MTIAGIKNRTFEFKAPTAEKATEWVLEIQNHIVQSEGFKNKISGQNLKKPWRFDNMSESQFKALADTGDILLFRGTKAGSLVTRALTLSHFDHVAMVLKFESDQDEVFLVEATGNMGVSLNRWDFLREHVGKDKFYDKLVFRHVEYDRGAKMVDNLEKFLSEAVGLKYGLGGGKLMRQKTAKLKETETNQLISEERTFFCSELVAKAFKSLGVIADDDTSCAKYFPHHFSSRGDSALKLTPGTVIEPEQMVLVDGLAES